MDFEGILAALQAGEFDGVNHDYKPYKGYGKTSYQTSMHVVGDTINVTKTSSGKFFNGKENERWSESSTDLLSGPAAVNFIEQRPYYFQQVRPDLF